MNRKQRLKSRRNEQGLCHDCKNPTMTGKFLCKNHFKIYKAYHAARYAEKIAAGLCPQCGKNPPVIGKVQCVSCRTQAIRLNRRRIFHYRAVKFNWSHKASISAQNLASLWRKQRGVCALTARKLTIQNAEVDHILPKSRGGTHEVGNLRWTIKEVNRLKRDRTDEEFFLLCRQVVACLEKERNR